VVTVRLEKVLVSHSKLDVASDTADINAEIYSLKFYGCVCV